MTLIEVELTAMAKQRRGEVLGAVDRKKLMSGYKHFSNLAISSSKTIEFIRILMIIILTCWTSPHSYRYSPTATSYHVTSLNSKLILCVWQYTTCDVQCCIGCGVGTRRECLHRLQCVLSIHRPLVDIVAKNVTVAIEVWCTPLEVD